MAISSESILMFVETCFLAVFLLFFSLKFLIFCSLLMLSITGYISPSDTVPEHRSVCLQNHRVTSNMASMGMKNTNRLIF